MDSIPTANIPSFSLIIAKTIGIYPQNKAPILHCTSIGALVNVL